MNLPCYHVFGAQKNREVQHMKTSRADVRCKAHKIPDVKFEDEPHSLTSFAGLVVFQQLFVLLGLKTRFEQCFREVKQGKIFGGATIFSNC